MGLGFLETNHGTTNLTCTDAPVCRRLSGGGGGGGGIGCGGGGHGGGGGKRTLQRNNLLVAGVLLPDFERGKKKKICWSGGVGNLLIQDQMMTGFSCIYFLQCTFHTTAICLYFIEIQ